MTHPRRILGLDPGLRVTGYAVLEAVDRGPQLCEAGVLRPAPGPDPTDLAPRIRSLYDALCEVLDQWRPAVMAVEQLYAHYEHPRTAVLMAHARGVFLLAGALRDIPVFSYAPSTVKRLVTGSGRAGKDQVQRAVARELGLPGPPEPHDVADALALALCHYHAGRGPTSGTVQAAFVGVNPAALAAPDRPTGPADDPTAALPTGKRPRSRRQTG